MVSESIFSGKSVIVPMADVQHIERHFNSSGEFTGIQIITDKTKWDYKMDCWENPIWIGADDQAQEFISAWCVYRSELEAIND